MFYVFSHLNWTGWRHLDICKTLKSKNISWYKGKSGRLKCSKHRVEKFMLSKHLNHRFAKILCFYAILKLALFAPPKLKSWSFPVIFKYLRWLENSNMTTFGMRSGVTSKWKILLFFTHFVPKNYINWIRHDGKCNRMFKKVS